MHNWPARKILAALVVSAMLGGTIGMVSIPIAGVLLGELEGGPAAVTVFFNFLIGIFLAGPLALGGLAVAGIPAANAFGRFAARKWLPAVGFLAGGVLGEAFSRLVGLDFLGVGPMNLFNPGSMVGAWSGLWWAILANPAIDIWGNHASSKAPPNRHPE